MARRIHCVTCGVRALHKEDVADGWHQRSVILRVHKPESHGIRINGGPVQEIPTIRCDNCNAPIPNSSEAVAISEWRGDNPTRDWESEFGQVISRSDR
jgi:DNA-directed RNA polymerase subunit RPC12/RpoP